MNLLDFFKKREKIKRLEKSAAQAEPVLTQDDAGKSESRKVLGESKSAASVLQKPRITEKSSIMNESFLASLPNATFFLKIIFPD